MAKLKINRHGINFNEGGRFFTFYWKWGGPVALRLFRVWVAVGMKRYFSIHCYRGKLGMERVKHG